MAEIEAYAAAAGQDVAAGIEQPGYSIEIRFQEGLNEIERSAVKAAARRWTRIIAGDVPGIEVDGATVDDLLLFVRGAGLDGEGGILAKSILGIVRDGTLLPATAYITLDTDGLALIEASGRLEDVAVHEIGHCLGFGTLWAAKGLVAGAGGPDPTFSGARAMTAYAQIAGGHARPVPIENLGGAGSREAHWRESVFGNEVMTTSIPSPGNPISRLTVAALADMGYLVNAGAAEPYVFPPAALAGGLPPGWESLSNQ